MKKFVYGSLVAAAVVFSGCGGGGGSSTTTDTAAPVFASSVSATPSVAEGSLNVETITVTDDNPVTFTLGGDDKDSFELTPTQSRGIYSTTLKFKTAPDYESGAHTYHVSVTAADSAGNEATKEITVNVTDVPFGFADTVPSTVSTTVGTAKTITLADNGEGNATTTFTLVNDDNGAFSFDNNVTLTFNPGSAGTYTATVRATNGSVSVDKNITGTATAPGSGPADTVTINGHLWQTVGDYDNATGYVNHTWQSAVDYCSNLGSGWRLPTLSELNDTVVTPTDATVEYLDQVPSDKRVSTGFWTSTPDENNASRAHYIYLDTDHTNALDNIAAKTENGAVRCIGPASN